MDAQVVRCRRGPSSHVDGIRLCESKDTIMHRFTRMPEVAASFFTR